MSTNWQQLRIEPHLPAELKRQIGADVVVYDASQPSSNRRYIAAAIMVVALVCAALSLMAGRAWWNNVQASRACDQLYRLHGRQAEARVLCFEDRDLASDTSSFHLYFQFRPEFVIRQELHGDQVSALRNRRMVTVQHLNADPRVARLTG